MDDKVQAIIDTLNPASLRLDAGRFAPKLNFEERCAVLAAYLAGVNRRLLAVAFRINRRTVTHIYNSRSIHYKDVRKELEKLGREEFIRTYLTEHVATMLKTIEQDEAAKIIINLNDKEASKLAHAVTTPNKRRNKDEGYHTLHPEHCEYSHRVQIAWTSGFHGEGWYYRDLDGAFPSEWMHSGRESIITSTTALTGADIEIQDRLK